MMASPAQPPLIAHVVYRFDVGGLENGVVNLINAMPVDAYRHAIVSLTGISDFRQRIERPNVLFFALNKPPGHAIRLYPQLMRLFRELKPAIVHTRNLAALEASVPAWAAGVGVRIHGEHGRDVGDLDGSNVKYQWVRRLYRPFVTRYVALSRDLERYLTKQVGVPPARVVQFYNGVDLQRFHGTSESRTAIVGCPFIEPDLWLLGTVGRMQAVKDQLTLAHAFVLALSRAPALRARLRLVMVGDGPLRAQVLDILRSAGIDHLAWLPGERNDVSEVLRGLNCFVLPSLAEGISNTILEAMASALPVIATDVGGNRELVDEGVTGRLVPAADATTMADAILQYAVDPAKARAHGIAGRTVVEMRFSLEAMTGAYLHLYDSLLGRRPGIGLTAQMSGG